MKTREALLLTALIAAMLCCCRLYLRERQLRALIFPSPVVEATYYTEQKDGRFSLTIIVDAEAFKQLYPDVWRWEVGSESEHDKRP